MTSRTSTRLILEQTVGTYKADDLDHTALVTALEAAPYRWVLSGMPIPFIYPDWEIHFFGRKCGIWIRGGAGNYV